MNMNIAKNEPYKINAGVKPILNSVEWGKKAERNGELFAWCVPERSAENVSPAIGMIDVAGPHVKFLNTKDLGKELAKTKLMKIAFDNLEEQLSDIKWESIEVEIPGEENMKIAFLKGNEYCAEAILSKKVMQGAHDLLGEDMLFAIIPCRGVLMASKIYNDYAHASLFYKYGLYYYFNTDKTIISPDVWLVSNGEVKDISSPPGAVMENIKNSYREQFISVHQRKNIRINQNGIKTKGVEVRASVNSDTYESTLAWLQRDVRGLAEKMSHQFHAHPLIHIVLEVESNSACISEDIDDELQATCDFLTKQFQIFDYKVNRDVIKVTGSLDEITRRHLAKTFWINKRSKKNNIITINNDGAYFSTIPFHLMDGVVMKVMSNRTLPEIFTTNSFVLAWRDLKFIYNDKSNNEVVFHYQEDGVRGMISYEFSNRLDREMCFHEVKKVLDEKDMKVKSGTGFLASIVNLLFKMMIKEKQDKQEQ